MEQWKRASFRVDAGTSGFIYISDSDRTVPAEDPELLSRQCRKRRPSARVDGGVSGVSSSCGPVFLPGEVHGQRSLEGYSPRGRTESDTTDAT